MSMLHPLREASLKGKRVLLRAGFDVPMKNGSVTDDSRLRAVAPTIRAILDAGGSAILLAHQGRPHGKVVPDLSQRPIAKALSSILGQTVSFVSAVVGEKVNAEVDALAPGSVLLLENLRFEVGEEADDPAFAQQLASSADCYVNDAFTNCHRAHASVHALPRLLPSYMGLQLEQEVLHLSRVVESPDRPLALVVSGAKIETKLPIIERFMSIGDHILVGGGVANTFLAASGAHMQSSLVDASFMEQAISLLERSGSKGLATIHLPVDAVAAASIEAAETATVTLDAIPSGHMALDLGPETMRQYADVIASCRSVVWNGPLGAAELPAFAGASAAMARCLQSVAARGATVVIGGGDTLDVLARERISHDSFTFVSTAGGAMLSFLGGEEMPGLEALRR